MSFSHLDDLLAGGEDKNIELYLEIFKDLKEPTRNVLGYTLDIASMLHNSELDNEYVIFGGYAVLSHIMKAYGSEMARVWRGSDDIDMAGTPKVKTALKRGYSVSSDMPSPNLKDKRTLKLVEDHEQECKIDFYTGDFKTRFSPETNTHFGINVKVGSPISLIKGKIDAPFDEPLHSYDILTLLSILEKRGYNPSRIISNLNNNEKALLLEHIKNGIEHFGEDRIGLFPSHNFISLVKTRLHKFRKV
ncbi:hypothetical protein HYV49_02520 [Candidatus Pacearchaeota archaeon]|nr:hypothetical protein [Candidatus Pacearchaeota archaeon]